MIANLDADLRNADWTKTTWDLPTDPRWYVLKYGPSLPDYIAHLAGLPVFDACPPMLRAFFDQASKVEAKGVRHVRDSAYWGAPVGTPLPLDRPASVPSIEDVSKRSLRTTFSIAPIDAESTSYRLIERTGPEEPSGGVWIDGLMEAEGYISGRGYSELEIRESLEADGDFKAVELTRMDTDNPYFDTTVVFAHGMVVDPDLFDMLVEDVAVVQSRAYKRGMVVEMNGAFLDFYNSRETEGHPSNDAAAFSVTGDGHIVVDPSSYKKAIQSLTTMSDGSARRASTALIAHEWGHAVQPDKTRWTFAQDEAVIAVYIAQPGKPDFISAYAKTSVQEAYAEAFMDWLCSNGHPKSRGTINIAKAFEWDKRFPQAVT